MSGHNKWAGIKHRKMAQDSKRGQIFTRLIRELTISAKEGGGIPENNARLRKAMEDAQAANMPKENVKRAIQRGTGELPGVVYEEVSYEGYGPEGVAVMLDATTDNRNRTTSEIRKIFSEHGGNLGENGCVAWMFNKKGYISVNKTKTNEEELMDLVLESGAEDMMSDDSEMFEVTVSVENFEKVKSAIQSKNIPIESAEITYLPQTYVTLSDKKCETMLALMESLEEHEDVKNVYANFDIPKEVLEKVAAGV